MTVRSAGGVRHRPLLATTTADHATLLLGGASPHTGVLVRGKREFEARLLSVALDAHGLGDVDLLDCHAGGPHREKQPGVRVAATCIFAPIDGRLESVGGERHGKSPWIVSDSGTPSRPGNTIETGSRFGKGGLKQVLVPLVWTGGFGRGVFPMAMWACLNLGMAAAPMVIAHRGAREVAQENTLPAFRMARELGADWVELDVRRTADGVVVVHHDAHLGDGRMVSQLNSGELPAFVPSLAEALEECHGMGVNIEIKNLPSDPDYDADHLVSDAVAGLVHAYLGPERALVSSFNMDTLDRLRAVDPTIPLAYLYAIGEPASAIARACAHEMAAIHPYDPLVTATLVERAQDEGLRVNVWTVNDPERMEALVGHGVDGICTDVPDVARQVFDQLNPPTS